MERRLAAILCADVAGYSRMMGIDEAGTHAAFKAHRGAIHPIILNHAGRIVKHTGDGFLLEFANAASAIQFGVEMQCLMAERNAELPADRSMRFRLGIHKGEFTIDDGQAFGDGINVAVNLESIATPGGVAVSAKAYEEASPQLPVRLTSAGSFQFRDLQEPVQAWTWEPGSETTIRARTNAATLPPQYRTAIVGVLPFVNLADGPDEYLADGLADDLIHALSLQSFFRVLSRTSTFRFRDRGLNPRLVAREIDATYLIQGTVRRSLQKIRVTAELIAPETGAQLWAGRYDRDLGDLFAMQDEITTSLCAALMPEIYRVEASVPVRSSAADPTAWDRFLRGLSHYYRPTKADYEVSITLFREAIGLDPTLGIAHAYLATILMQGINFGWIKGSRELWDEAKSLALDSVRLDARSSFAYAILAFVQAMQGAHEDGMKAARKATELNAYDMGARGVLGLCHMVSGDHQQAIDQFSIAAQRGNSDPRYQWPALNAYSHYLIGRYEAALSWAREELFLYPNHLQALTIRAATLAQLGDRDQARDAIGALCEQYPWLTLDRHMKNIRWRKRDDIEHYRDGLIKAGLT
ncbi:adenylate cyclase [Bradyrhizobium sp. 83012]|uniref:Adenylate cyclase n=1 Tax=Bradyrhizobium aeschynomenes TaxID=2734909 RepID=A0ABX2CIZ3_9BRAD|nr:adenylate/guanylate cyclase domain-containing protein [Bradyrhizobium aeschynomenes]NPU11072.1 adenylate cyclase [Bradyrhizobium aeschynomenes]NPU68162.1 adenylate cyclase [Bradyrhizobium aeschynomenes]NPV21729.1 adenylate cyclase [Bradyrhizobium aeschynomenes]